MLTIRKLIGSGLFVAALILGALAYARTMRPGTNTLLVGCVEGRAFRIVGGYPACTIAPTVSNCGSGAALSANATELVGQITTGTSLLGAAR